MWMRIRQVVSAVTAKIEEGDRRFLSRYLNPAEQLLFWGMNLPDQRHALNVAYTALKLAQDGPVDKELLVKCALLHDVGKVQGDVSTLDKIITVIVHRLAPEWAKQWGRCGKGSILQNLRHAVYIYYHHPQRSATMLRGIGEHPVIVDVVSRHHEAPAGKEPPELIILRKADNLH